MAGNRSKGERGIDNDSTLGRSLVNNSNSMVASRSFSLVYNDRRRNSVVVTLVRAYFRPVMFVVERKKNRFLRLVWLSRIRRSPPFRRKSVDRVTLSISTNLYTTNSLVDISFLIFSVVILEGNYNERVNSPGAM